MLYSTATTCEMRYQKKTKRFIYQNILRSRPIRLPTGQYILFSMYCIHYDHATMSSIANKHINIAIKTIHLYSFQQKLYRPTFTLSHDTEVAIMVLNILIIAKKNLIMLGGVPENPVIDCKIIDQS